MFSFFKSPRHQKFHYNPRYYDPAKDKVNEIMSQYEEGDVSADQVKARISRSFKSTYARKGGAKGSFNRRSNFLLVAIILALLFLSYYVISAYLPRILEYLEA